jgi:hypothetical protein
MEMNFCPHCGIKWEGEVDWKERRNFKYEHCLKGTDPLSSTQYQVKLEYRSCIENDYSHTNWEAFQMWTSGGDDLLKSAGVDFECDHENKFGEVAYWIKVFKCLKVGQTFINENWCWLTTGYRFRLSIYKGRFGGDKALEMNLCEIKLEGSKISDIVWKDKQTNWS